MTLLWKVDLKVEDMNLFTLSALVGKWDRRSILKWVVCKQADYAPHLMEPIIWNFSKLECQKVLHNCFTSCYFLVTYERQVLSKT